MICISNIPIDRVSRKIYQKNTKNGERYETTWSARSHRRKVSRWYEGAKKQNSKAYGHNNRGSSERISKET